MFAPIRTAALLLATAALLAKAERDTSFPACDVPDKSGKVPTRYTTDKLPFYIPSSKGVKGACDVAYTENTYGACVKPGWVHSAFYNNCGQKLSVKNLSNGKTTNVVILDVCGAVPDSDFHCNDIALTQAAFVALGGDTTKGTLDSQVEWVFTSKH